MIKKKINNKSIERKALAVSTIVNFITAIAGIIIYIITGLNALLLDSVFSAIGCASTLAGFYITKNSHRKTKNFPNSMYFLEPLFGILKSIATLMLLIIASLESATVAYAYFFKNQGSPITIGPAFPYAIITGTMCLLLAYYNHKKNKSINNLSTMLQAEIKANFVDGIISYGIGLTLLMLYFIAIDGKLGFLHYTGDFFITIMLVAISFKEPLMVLIHSFKEFAYSTVQDQEIKASIISVFKAELPNHLENLDITIYKQGMQINVRVFIIGIDNTDTIEELALEKANLLNHLRKEFEQISLEFTF